MPMTAWRLLHILGSDRIGQTQQLAKDLTEPDAPLRDGELVLQRPYQCLGCRQLLMLWPKASEVREYDERRADA